MKNHLPFFACMGLCINLLGCSEKEEQQVSEGTNPPPNIVIIFTDDQGYNDVGVFGAQGFETPNLDQMAEEGVKFTNFYVPHAVCSASRASILTGCYANRLGIYGALDHTAKHGLNPEEVTIAELVKPLGYQTAMVGKWHLGHLSPFLPTEQGFDEFFGLPYSNDMWPHHPERPNHYPPLPLYEGNQVIDTLDDQSNLTTWYTERAVGFIEKNKDTPFLLYLAHNMPHVPLFVSDKFKGKSQNGLYGDVIMEIDWSVGEVLKSLKENGIEENTLVIFTSDNGPWLSYGAHSGSADPLREGKGTSWEGGIRVPTIMRWPGRLPAGKVQAQNGMTIDILPTIAHLTDAELPDHKIDGKNIWPMMENPESGDSPHDAYFIYYNTNELQAVLMGEWKLYFPHTYRSIQPGQATPSDGTPMKYEMLSLEEPELYNLKDDIKESRNVIDENPQIVQEMMALADRAREDLGDALTNKEGKNRREVGRFAGVPARR
ncbi:sulfatase family protein [Pleomorphovibrio marinus]|uniref:sulfatase family protein n=1 Tax=Pleomorphovibrio marinus TaxID=2164132 RepID=UPI001E53647E|nr:sulfatase [Pleomorphovibrio marinus]